MMEHNLRVFVVRHGEREDEVCSQMAYRKMSQEQRLDPMLTALGHEQAMHAFTNLVGSLGGPKSPHEPQPRRRVAVFCSPLRRAVGIALMISPAVAACIASQTESLSTDGTYDLDWTLPIRQAQEEQDSTIIATPAKDATGENSSNSSIPIVILNGLCDCAAQINKIGGHQNAIRAGFLKCATVSTNNHLNMSSPILSELNLMTPFLANAMDTLMNGSTSRTSRARKTLPVQYVRLTEGERDGETGPAFVPMTPPVSVRIPASMSVEQTMTTYRETSVSPRKCGRLSAIEQAVILSIDAGCDTCIVVSHREEIRDLYKNKCGYEKHRLSIPYCCIGRFVVSVQDIASSWSSRTTPDFHWTFHGLTPPEEMTPALVPVLPLAALSVSFDH